MSPVDKPQASVGLERPAAEGEAACRRTCRDEETRRREILDAATELFAEHGFSEAVTQALVERLGVGKGTLYRYFPSKRDLFLASVDRVMRRLREHIDGKILGIAEPFARLSVAVWSFLEFFGEHPKYVELLVQERALFKDRTRPTYVVHREANVARWVDVYRSLIAVGRVRDIPVERITSVLGNMCYGTVFFNYFSGCQKPSREQADDILDVFFHGILSDSERRRACGRGD